MDWKMKVHAHECVSFLLIKDDTILLEKRSMAKASDAGLMAIPGGHIEKGETRHQALWRELGEELSIQPLSAVYLCSLYHPTSELQLIHYYVVAAWSGTPEAIEADDISWHPVTGAPVDIIADRTALTEYTRLQISGMLPI